MKARMAQEYAVHREQVAKIHWTTTFTEVCKLLFFCFAINYPCAA